MSFQIAISPTRKAAARLVGSVRRKLQWAFAENPQVSRSEIADRIGVHRSVITRQLNGRADISLSRVAEIAHALGYEAQFHLRKSNAVEGSNLPDPQTYWEPGAFARSVGTSIETAQVTTTSDHQKVLVASQ